MSHLSPLLFNFLNYANRPEKVHRAKQVNDHSSDLVRIFPLKTRKSSQIITLISSKSSFENAHSIWMPTKMSQTDGKFPLVCNLLTFPMNLSDSFILSHSISSIQSDCMFISNYILLLGCFLPLSLSFFITQLLL